MSDPTNPPLPNEPQVPPTQAYETPIVPPPPYTPAQPYAHQPPPYTQPTQPYAAPNPYATQPNPYAPAPAFAAADAPEGQKSFVATWLLSWLVGLWGIDRFYLGKVGTGLAKLFTLGGLGIWWLVDVILVLTGAQRDKLGYRLQGYQQHKKVAWIITGAVMAFSLLMNIVTGGIGSSRNAAPEPAPFVASTEAAAKPSAKAVTKPTATPKPTVAKVAIPAGLVGMTAADASNALEAVGLVAVYDGDPTAKVLSVSPSTAEVEAGSTITLTVEQPPALSMGQQQAVGKAKSYLAYTSFSRSGLIGQLEYEGFSTDDATFAVDYVNPDWNAQAAAKAKSYLEYTSFSREGLIDQLLYEGFSPEQAEYGVTANGY